MDHVLEFEKYLKEDGKRDSTILSYTGDVRGFLDYLASKGSPFHGQIVRFYITSYKDHLGQLGYKVNTINKKSNSLVCFNQFLLEREIMDRMVVDLRRDKILDFLTMQLQVVGKGGKIREVPLRPEVVEVAREYMATERKEHKFAESAYLLLTQRAGKMDRDTVNKLLKKHGEYLGITM